MVDGKAFAYDKRDIQHQLERGEYLARAADCISCHTGPNGIPYAGGLSLNTPFGVLKTPNITPDLETGIGGWTSDEFYNALHYGVRPDGQLLYPAFPYDFYSKMPRVDVDAIYLYLRSLDPVVNNVEVNLLRFPFNIRLTLLVWRFLYFEPATFEYDTNQTSLWNRGAYLVEGPGHCSACHTPRNILGASKTEESYSGGEVENWYAMNITSNLSVGIGRWSVSELVEFLGTGRTGQRGSALGPMREVIDNSLSHLTREDLKAIAIYLKSLPAKNGQEMNQQITKEQTNSTDGRLIYLKYCAGCHHPRGTGRSGLVPALTTSSTLAAEDPTNLLNVILFGVPPQFDYEAMPEFQTKMTSDETAALVNYLRSRWGNSQASPVTPTTVENWSK